MTRRFLYAGLDEIGRMDDARIDLARAALTIAARAHPGISVQRYATHLARLTAEVRARHAALSAAEGGDTLEARRRALVEILAGQEGYRGDAGHYDDLQNADLMRVIDRRKGLPITLSLLYLHVARSLGWEADGLNVPGHFVIRLALNGERMILDAFLGGQVLQAADLRQIVKKALGGTAELSAAHTQATSNRAILIRLLNNIKIRQIESEDYAMALVTVQAMRAIDPSEYRLLLDDGVLQAKIGAHRAAIKALSDYIGRSPDAREREDARLLLRHLEGQVN